MPANKTQPTRASVSAFLAAVARPEVRRDARALAALMRRVTGERAVLWGTGIVGFGLRHYRYDSGREGDAPVIAFSPRSDRLTLYLACDLDRHRSLLARLGRHARGKGCLHVRRLEDVDGSVLEELVRAAAAGEPATAR